MAKHVAACPPAVDPACLHAACLHAALADTGSGHPIPDVRPTSVSYVAVHGTGTPLGDPIEMGALGQALSCQSIVETAHRVVIGSVKSCYGHTEGAAGLTGAMLAVQALHHQVGLCCTMTCAGRSDIEQ